MSVETEKRFGEQEPEFDSREQTQQPEIQPEQTAESPGALERRPEQEPAGQEDIKKEESVPPTAEEGIQTISELTGVTPEHAAGKVNKLGEKASISSGDMKDIEGALEQLLDPEQE